MDQIEQARGVSVHQVSAPAVAQDQVSAKKPTLRWKLALSWGAWIVSRPAGYAELVAVDLCRGQRLSERVLEIFAKHGPTALPVDEFSEGPLVATRGWERLNG